MPKYMTELTPTQRATITRFEVLLAEQAELEQRAFTLANDIGEVAQ